MIDIRGTLETALALSRADACIAIGRRQTTSDVRWANNTVTTNGASDETALSVISIVGRRVASVNRTYVRPDQIEEMVRESEAACARRPEAPDYMPLLDGSRGADDWTGPLVTADFQAFDAFAPKLGTLVARARRANVQTFGYANHGVSAVWLATSTGLRRRHADRIGKVEITAKTPDFTRSSWAGTVAHDFDDVDPGALFDKLDQRLAWSERRIALAAGQYEVLLEPSCTADLALEAYASMTRRDADEGRSPYSRAAGGTLIGDRLFGGLTMYSDPDDPDVPAVPFHVGVASGEESSVFDNGLPVSRTEWVRDGELRALVTPRWWAAKVGAPQPVPYVGNLVVAGDGSTLDRMIADTRRALLVTCFWYIRTVDPQRALLTGLTRDGVFLIEDGEVRGAVNNFRWNMSPIALFAQATEVGRTGPSLPREHDEFLRVKAPPVRIERFNMSSVSDAS